MTFKVRDNYCVECPYLEKNKKFLDKKQHSEIVRTNAVFPCHMELKGVVGKTSEGVEEYAKKVKVFVICRGRAKEMGIIL